MCGVPSTGCLCTPSDPRLRIRTEGKRLRELQSPLGIYWSKLGVLLGRSTRYLGANYLLLGGVGDRGSKCRSSSTGTRDSGLVTRTDFVGQMSVSTRTRDGAPLSTRTPDATPPFRTLRLGLLRGNVGVSEPDTLGSFSVLVTHHFLSL